MPVGYPQAGLHGGAQAAADAIVALVERDRSGLGQHLDVSMQACTVWTTMDASGYPPNEGHDKPGFGDDRAEPTPAARVRPGPATRDRGSRWPRHRHDGRQPAAADRPQRNHRLDARGGRRAAEHLQSIDWEHWHEDFLDPAVPARSVPLINEAIRLAVDFIGTKPKRELLDRAAASGALIAPITTAVDLLADRQLEDRGYWTQVGVVRMPGRSPGSAALRCAARIPRRDWAPRTR